MEYTDNVDGAEVVHAELSQINDTQNTAAPHGITGLAHPFARCQLRGRKYQRCTLRGRSYGGDGGVANLGGVTKRSRNVQSPTTENPNVIHFVLDEPERVIPALQIINAEEEN